MTDQDFTPLDRDLLRAFKRAGLCLREGEDPPPGPPPKILVERRGAVASPRWVEVHKLAPGDIVLAVGPMPDSETESLF